jgi:hypothetical protein
MRGKIELNLCGFRQFSEHPNASGPPRFQGRGVTQGLVKAAKVVVPKPQQVSGTQADLLLAKSVSQARQEPSLGARHKSGNQAALFFCGT